MTCLFEREFKDRYFEMGIGEQNMVSTAAGLALSGKIAFVNSLPYLLQAALTTRYA